MKKVIWDLGSFHEGIFDAVGSIASTYGYYGHSVLIGVGGEPLVTRDGAMVSNHLAVSDPVGALAARMVKDGALSTYGDAGDGTTTCAVLIGAMVADGLAKIGSSKNCYDYVRDLGLAVDVVVDVLNKSAEDIRDEGMMVEVATISANNDLEMGSLIGEMAYNLGVHGSAQFEEGTGEETSIDLIEGYFFEGGAFDKEMNRGTIVVSSPTVFLCAEKLDMTEDLAGVFTNYWDEARAKSGTLESLVIVCPDVTQSVLANMQATVLQLRQVRPDYNILFVKAPAAENMDDLAFLLDTKVWGNRYGRPLSGAKDFGTCKRVRVDSLGSVFFHDKGSDIINDYVEEGEIKGDRASRLQAGIGLIKVGGSTSVERNNVRLMLDDTYKTCFAALRDGVIAGGGYGLYSAGSGTGFEDIFSAPIKKLLSNKFGELSKEPRSYLDKFINEHQMYNLKTGEWSEDHKDLGLYDAVRATSSAVKNAYSVAAQILTLSQIIIEEQNIQYVQ